MGFLVEHRDELVADDLAFFLRISDSGELNEKTLRGIYGDYMQPQLVTQVLLDFFKLVLAEHAVVDEHAGQARLVAIAKSAIHEHCCHGGVDPARECAKGASRTDLLAYGSNCGVYEMLWRPRGFCFADIQDKIPQDFSSQPGVFHLRMKLDCEQSSACVFNRGDGRWRFRNEGETRRQLQCLIAMRHPDFELSRKIAKKFRTGDAVDVSVTIFPMFRSTYLPAKRMRHELQAVTDPEHRDAKFEHARVGRGRVLVIDGRWPAGENDADGQLLANLLDAAVAGEYYGIDALLAYPAGDQLRILRPEIENDD